jgi:hypothetical protein
MILIILIVRSLSSEVVLFNMHTELLKSKPISKYLVKSSTHYYPQLNKVAQGISISHNLFSITQSDHLREFILSIKIWFTKQSRIITSRKQEQ